MKYFFAIGFTILIIVAVVFFAILITDDEKRKENVIRSNYDNCKDLKRFHKYVESQNEGMVFPAYDIKPVEKIMRELNCESKD